MKKKIFIIFGLFLIAALLIWLLKKEIGEDKVQSSKQATPPPSAPLAPHTKNSVVLTTLTLPQQKGESSEALSPECAKKLALQMGQPEFYKQNRENLKIIVGDWFFDSKAATTKPIETSASGKFFVALAESGYLSGLALERNDEDALRLLDEVHKMEPTNSAPLLYAAAIESRSGNLVRADELLELARNTHKFDAYNVTVAQAIYSGVRNSSDLIQASAMWAKTPIPDEIVLMKLLKDRDSGAFFGKQMTSQAFEEENLIPDVDWSPMDYSVGRVLLKGQNENLPSALELQSQKKDRDPLSPQRFLNSAKTCDLQAMDEMTLDLQRHLEKRKNP